MTNTLRDTVLKRRVALESERSSYEAHWMDLGRYLLPRRGRWFDENGRNRGRKMHQRIINSAGLIASRTLASGMHSGLTNPARPWFRLTVADPDLADFWSVRAWLDDVAQRMRDVLARSNFYNVLPMMYRELGVFGTSPIAMMEDDRDVVRFYNFTVGSYYIAQNDRLVVDTFCRRFRWTIAQAVSKYGEDALNRNDRAKLRQGKLEETIQYTHIIEPNRDYMPGYADAKGMPYRSVVIDEASDDKDTAVEDKGFHEFPVLCSRWETMEDTPYGSSSPGMDALGDVRSLQFHEIKSAGMLDKMNDPPLQAPGALENKTISLLPGQVTYRPPTQGSDAKVEPLYVPEPQAFNYTQEAINKIEKRVQSAFFADLFMMIDQMPGVQPRTVMEIMERKEEKMLALGPVLEQLDSDTFDPMIDRLFNIMWRRGLIPKPPPELEGWPLKVEYTSILAQAQKAVATGNIERFAAFAGQLAGVNPQVLDRVNFDNVIDDYAEATGIPAKEINSDEVVQQIRQQRQQQQNMEMAAKLAPALKQGVQAMGEAATTQPAEDNMLTALANSGALPS